MILFRNAQVDNVCMSSVSSDWFEIPVSGGMANDDLHRFTMDMWNYNEKLCRQRRQCLSL